MFVICQNDFPLVIVSDNKEVAEEVRKEIQKRCDKITRKLYPQYGKDFRQIFIHMHEIPEIQSFQDIDNKLYWNNWNAVAQYKRERGHEMLDVTLY